MLPPRAKPRSNYPAPRRAGALCPLSAAGQRSERSLFIFRRAVPLVCTATVIRIHFSAFTSQISFSSNYIARRARGQPHSEIFTCIFSGFCTAACKICRDAAERGCPPARPQRETSKAELIYTDLRTPVPLASALFLSLAPIRRIRVAVPRICFAPCRALANCRPLPPLRLPSSPAGRGRLRSPLDSLPTLNDQGRSGLRLLFFASGLVSAGGCAVKGIAQKTRPHPFGQGRVYRVS